MTQIRINGIDIEISNNFAPTKVLQTLEKAMKEAEKSLIFAEPTTVIVRHLLTEYGTANTKLRGTQVSLNSPFYGFAVTGNFKEVWNQSTNVRVINIVPALQTGVVGKVVRVKSNSPSGKFYNVSVFSDNTVECPCEGFRFRKSCDHVNTAKKEAAKS